MQINNDHDRKRNKPPQITALVKRTPKQRLNQYATLLNSQIWEAQFMFRRGLVK
jgi:hypothetical protein